MKKSQGEMGMRMLNGFLFIIAMLFFSYGASVSAESEGNHKVLVIYSSEDGEVDEYQRTLDMIIGHFTSDITFKSSDEVKKIDLAEVTHLFYFGQVAKKMPASFSKLFDEYTGYFIALGYNSEHLGGRFSFINPLHEIVVDELVFTADSKKKLAITPEYVIDIERLGQSEVLVEGKGEGDPSTYPIVIKSNKNYYFSIDNFSAHKKIIVGEILHEVFGEDHEKTRPAYIRLEDIHPLVDPQNVEDITKMLKEKNIPFMMATIPVYTNPETGKEHHFSDSPKLLKVLKEAQKNGGSIVLHGYTHQYRDSETGEGFEFWDVESNTPIYADAYEKFTLQEESEFANQKDYESYMNELTEFESEYIRTKVTRGIQELTNYGLYPLAFEAPHYTMSQNGYQVLSEYFSTYIGQIQLSDTDWELMGTAPHITTPSFLNGMEVLPETLGYVQPEDPEAIQKMMDSAGKFELTSDGILGAFYHPYLGVEQFEELIEEMEVLPNISWIDLQKMDVWVKADNVEIFTKNGEISTKIKQGGLLLASMDFPIYHLGRFIEIIIWIMAVVGGLAVISFIGCTFFLATRNIKLEG